MTMPNLTKCHKCEKDITEGKIIESAGKSYHLVCFVCDRCEKPIAGTYFPRTENNKSISICAECRKNELPSKQCAMCDGPVTGGTEDIVHNDKVFHKRCFACTCGSAIKPGESFRMKMDSEKSKIILQCKNCIEKSAKICTACGKPVAPGARYVHSQEKFWHDECFKCSKCEQVISDGSYCPSDAGGILCTNCAV
ncbi:hypothetical protein ACOME3_003344 [Neoechinorhynchus agilis]